MNIIIINLINKGLNRSGKQQNLVALTNPKSFNPLKKLIRKFSAYLIGSKTISLLTVDLIGLNPH